MHAPGRKQRPGEPVAVDLDNELGRCDSHVLDSRATVLLAERDLTACEAPVRRRWQGNKNAGVGPVET